MQTTSHEHIQLAQWLWKSSLNLVLQNIQLKVSTHGFCGRRFMPTDAFTRPDVRLLHLSPQQQLNYPNIRLAYFFQPDYRHIQAGKFVVHATGRFTVLHPLLSCLSWIARLHDLMGQERPTFHLKVCHCHHGAPKNDAEYAGLNSARLKA